jgi:hypothetical protein
MNTIYELLRDWKDAIAKVYSEYPLAGAIVTVAGAIGFVLFERGRKKWPPPPFDCIIALVVWLVAVPILGFIFGALAKVFGFLSGAASFIWNVLSFIYAVYQTHPLFILILIVLTAAACAIWHWRWRRNMHLWAKMAICAVVFVVVVGIASPIINLFSRQLPTASDAKQPH